MRFDVLLKPFLIRIKRLLDCVLVVDVVVQPFGVVLEVVVCSRMAEEKVPVTPQGPHCRRICDNVGYLHFFSTRC